MQDPIVATASLEIDRNPDRRATYPLRMRIHGRISVDAKAPPEGVSGTPIFPAFLTLDSEDVFGLRWASLKEPLKALPEILRGHSAIFEALRQLAGGLDQLHDLGIVHGFLRADSILADKVGNVRIPDWFVRWESLPAEDLPAISALVAPEFLQEDGIGPATDQFALACVAYRLIYSVEPFAAESKMEQLLRVTCGVWSESTRLEKDIGVCDVWDRAFSVQPAWRFATCIAFVDALENAIQARSTAIQEEDSTDQGAAAKASPAWVERLLWGGAIVFAVASLGLGVYTSRLTGQLAQFDGQGLDAESESMTGGLLSVCNSGPTPVQILEVATFDRSSATTFSSSDHKGATWTIAPASRQSLSFASNGRILWDGRVFFYYVSYETGGDDYVSTGIWHNSPENCLELAEK